MLKKNIPSRVGMITLVLAMLLWGNALAQAASGGNPDNSYESKPYTAAATTSTSANNTELPSMGSYLFKMVISLAVIFGLAYAGLRYLPRKLTVLPDGEFISIYDQYALAPNKAIYIAEIGGKVVTLGVTDHNISVINEITDQDLIREMREAHLVNNRPTNWDETKSKLLNTIMGSKAMQELPFSSHMQQQISKLQDIAAGKVTEAKGKDDTLV